MDTPIIVALISAGGAVLAALIALLPHLLNKEKKPPRAGETAAHDLPPSRPTAIPAAAPPEPRPPAKRGEEAPRRPRDPEQTEAEADTGRNASEGLIGLSGTSAGSPGAPRELDLLADGEEIQLHIHPPGGSQPKVWVTRAALQAALDDWHRSGGAAERIEVPARTARKEGAVALVFQGEVFIEVQAGWWVWVDRRELRDALGRLGVRARW